MKLESEVISDNVSKSRHLLLEFGNNILDSNWKWMPGFQNGGAGVNHSCGGRIEKNYINGCGLGVD